MNIENRRARLRLTGTAVLERPNLPVLSSTFEYYNGDADNCFRDRLESYQTMELSQLAFGFNCYPNRIMRNDENPKTQADFYQLTLAQSDRLRLTGRNRYGGMFKGVVAGLFVVFMVILFRCLLKGE